MPSVGDALVNGHDRLHTLQGLDDKTIQLLSTVSFPGTIADALDPQCHYWRPLDSLALLVFTDQSGRL
jgi:hypothetical protein